MTYLTQYVADRPGSVVSLTRGARVDEHTPLNRPGLYGDAYVRVYVGDTSGRPLPPRRRRLRRSGPRSPRLVLQIADCTNEINLEFSLESAGFRENSLFKIDTLLDALHRFRDGLAAEAELAQRQLTPRRVMHHRRPTAAPKGGARCRT